MKEDSWALEAYKDQLTAVEDNPEGRMMMAVDRMLAAAEASEADTDLPEEVAH